VVETHATDDIQEVADHHACQTDRACLRDTGAAANGPRELSALMVACSTLRIRVGRSPADDVEVVSYPGGGVNERFVASAFRKR